MRRTTTLTAAGLLGLALLAPMTATSAASAAGETCHGEAATIVGGPGILVEGTEGRDVVVTNRSPRVHTHGGDDLICITGPDLGPGRYNGVDIDAGAGDDVVDGRAADSWTTEVVLGAGADRFEGGAAPDRVIGGVYSADYVTMVDSEVDVIVGGGGDDYLSGGQDGLPSSDVLQGGDGDDRLRFDGTWTTASVLDGGAGTDSIGLALAAGDNTLDNVAGELRHGATAVRRWTSLESFRLDDPATGTADVRIQGGPSSESFRMSGLGRVVADLGGGDDSFAAPRPLTSTSVLTGTAGQDRIAIGSTERPIKLDLESGRMEVGADYTIPVEGFQDAFVAAPRVEIRGTDDANDLYAVSCRVTLVGRNGRDRLGQGGDYAFGEFKACSERTVMKGGRGHDTFRSRAGAADRMVGGRGNDTFDARGGRDVLFGGPGNDRATLGNAADVFWGGPGRDKVDGQGGPDICRAEREKRCER